MDLLKLLLEIEIDGVGKHEEFHPVYTNTHSIKKLIEKGYVTENTQEKEYILTEKGKKTLQAIDRLFSL